MSSPERLVTVDSIVRSYIASKGMVLHDYFRLLVIAIEGVRNIAQDVNIGTNVKFLEIPVNEFGEAYLPQDCVEVNRILLPNGDRIFGMAKIDSINPLAKYENGTQVKRSESQIQNRPVYDNYPHINMTEFGEFTGRYYGIPTDQKHLFTLYGDKIQFDTRLNLGCVHIAYTTRGVNLADVNLIHPWAEDAVKCYIEWKYVEARKGIWENQNERRYFYNEKRNAHGRISGFGYAEYMEIVRSHNVLTFKS